MLQCDHFNWNSWKSVETHPCLVVLSFPSVTFWCHVSHRDIQPPACIRLTPALIAVLLSIPSIQLYFCSATSQHDLSKGVLDSKIITFYCHGRSPAEKKTSCRTRSAERGALKGESRDKKINSEKQQTINIE